MSVFNHLTGLVSSKLKQFNRFFTLAKLEARLAGLSLIHLLVNLCLGFIILTTLWLSAMAFIGVLLFQYLDSLWMSIGGVFLLNLAILALLATLMIRNIKDMSFEKTRRFFSHSKDETAYELENKAKKSH